jgi:hypothetical protein
MVDPLTRREFLELSAGVAGAAVAVEPVPASVIGANGRIRIGFIGPGGRGFGAHVKTLARLHKEGVPVDLVAVSEVYKKQEDDVCGYIAKETGVEPSASAPRTTGTIARSSMRSGQASTSTPRSR